MCRADTRAATTTEDSRPNLADEASEEEFMSTGQPAASRRLFRVGPNAFDKYERGLIEPSGPTVQLITILNRHPELVKELEGA